MQLPEPMLDGDVSLERTIHKRRTVRSFDRKALTLKHLSQLLWAAQGITETGGFKRAAPSAGALYPMDIYAVVGRDCIEKLDPGVHHYRRVQQDYGQIPPEGSEVRHDRGRSHRAKYLSSVSGHGTGSRNRRSL